MCGFAIASSSKSSELAVQCDGRIRPAAATRHGSPISLTSLVERPAPTRESKAAAAAAAFPSSWAFPSSSERAHLMLPFPLSLITHFLPAASATHEARGRLHRSGFLRRPDDGGGRGARRRHRAHAPGRPCKHTSTQRRGAQRNVATSPEALFPFIAFGVPVNGR